MKNKLCKLSDEFYKQFDRNQFRELLFKKGRPFNCIVIEYGKMFICVPYRTNINHSNAYKFRHSKRSQNNQSGLDYSKLVILENEKYVDFKNVIVDLDEYKETLKKQKVIENAVMQYIKVYWKHKTGKKRLSKKSYSQKYRFSTLKYFNKEILKLFKN